MLIREAPTTVLEQVAFVDTVLPAAVYVVTVGYGLVDGSSEVLRLKGLVEAETRAEVTLPRCSLYLFRWSSASARYQTSPRCVGGGDGVTSGLSVEDDSQLRTLDDRAR